MLFDQSYSRRRLHSLHRGSWFCVLNSNAVPVSVRNDDIRAAQQDTHLLRRQHRVGVKDMVSLVRLSGFKSQLSHS